MIDEKQGGIQENFSSSSRGLIQEIQKHLKSLKYETETMEELINLIDPLLKDVQSGSISLDHSEFSPPELNQELERSIKGIREDLTRITSAVEEFRHSTRSGQQYVELDFQEIVDTAVEMSRCTIESYGTLNYMSPDETNFSVKGNKLQLEKTIMNLITNAGHALETACGKSETFEGRVDVTLRKIQRDFVPLARVEVSDNGCGISDDMRDSIFSPYVTTKNHGNGFGIGLSKGREVVKQHGGQLELKETEVGQGSTFLLELPIQSDSD